MEVSFEYGGMPADGLVPSLDYGLSTVSLENRISRDCLTLK